MANTFEEKKRVIFYEFDLVWQQSKEQKILCQIILLAKSKYVWCLLTNGCLSASQDNRVSVTSHYMNIHEYSTFKIRFNLQRWINIVNVNRDRKKTKGSPSKYSHKKSDKHPWWLSDDEYFVIVLLHQLHMGIGLMHLGCHSNDLMLSLCCLVETKVVPRLLQDLLWQETWVQLQIQCDSDSAHLSHWTFPSVSHSCIDMDADAL